MTVKRPLLLWTVTLALASCSFTPPKRSSSETSDSSSEATTSSETPSSSSSSSAPSSSASSSEDLDFDATITFATTGRSGNAIASFENQFTVTGLEGLQIESDGHAYYDGEGGVRLANYSSTGTLSFAFETPVVLSEVSVLASKYNNDSSALTVEVGEQSVSKSIKDKTYYGFALEPVETTSFTLTAAKKQRVNIQSIGLRFTLPTPTYPTAIAVSPSSKTISVGSSFTLGVEYEPAGTNQKYVSFASSKEDVASVDSNGKVKGLAEGTSTIAASALKEDGTYATSTCEVTVEEAPVYEKVEMKHTYKSSVENNIYELDTAPNAGKAKLLVIPVWFNDSSTFINESKKETVREDIEKAYFGAEEDIGWHSVKSFYEEESKGRLELSGTVTDWYEVNASYESFGPSGTGGTKTEDLVLAASNNFFKNDESKRKEYDCDGNGYLDGVMLIYAAPDYVSLNNSNYSNLWAYCYWLQNESQKNKASPCPNVFFWASYDFMYDSSTAWTKTGKSNYGRGHNNYCDPDAHTFIHEMGHVFGLDDYYDYGDNRYRPAGSFSMQDYNVGGHDAFSTVALGWTDPYIPNQSCTIQLGAFQATHDAILLTPEWNEYDSPFDEYLLLELFTPTGLNKFDCDHSYDGTQGPNATGIRLWHVDARLLACNKINRAGNDYIYDVANLTSNPNAGTYGFTQAFTNTQNNTDYGSPLGSSYDKYDLLHLIHADKNTGRNTQKNLAASSLFGNGSSFSVSDYQKQFPDGAKLDNGKTLGWSFSVSIQGSGDEAIATVTLTRD